MSTHYRKGEIILNEGFSPGKHTVTTSPISICTSWSALPGPCIPLCITGFAGVVSSLLEGLVQRIIHLREGDIICTKSCQPESTLRHGLAHHNVLWSNGVSTGGSINNKQPNHSQRGFTTIPRYADTPCARHLHGLLCNSSLLIHVVYFQ